MNHRHLFAPVETPPDEGWGSYEDTTEDAAKVAANLAAREDVAGFAALYLDRRFNECREAREVQ
jgi:hypothetical protein